MTLTDVELKMIRDLYDDGMLQRWIQHIIDANGDEIDKCRIEGGVPTVSYRGG